MDEDDLDRLREQVASRKQQGARAHLRLAQALVSHGQREEAVAVLKHAIIFNLAEPSGELTIVDERDELLDLLARLIPADEVSETVDDARQASVVGPFHPPARDGGRRVRASDYYKWEQALYAEQHHFEPQPIPPSPAKSREEFLRDLREAEDVHLRIDAANMLAAFGPDDELLRALVEACADDRLASQAYAALGKLLCIQPSTDFKMRPIHHIGSLATESVTPGGRSYARRPQRARQVGLAWLGRFVARRCAGDPALEYTRPVTIAAGSVLDRAWRKDPNVDREAIRQLRPTERWWLALNHLWRAATDKEADDVIAEFPELEP